ncbi:MAG: NAD(P)/FAD-dependent oxidoreductase [Alphaproteobacteria bacterium]|nr:NAD(P)/FAD-dependent oxidoreductase [Alphaproteobacteria bacterium]
MSATQEKSVSSNTSAGPAESYDAIIVGAGFGGLAMLNRLRAQGLSVRVLEAGDGVGGTWYWNRYPGARCDVESMEYSYQFDESLQQEWSWPERYSGQAVILKYLNHVADRFDMRKDIQFNTRVSGAVFDEAAQRWTITAESGARMTAKYCVMATGCLSAPNTPDFNGSDSFKGDIYHTGKWPHQGVDFTGKRVGIIGTGSSAIQSIPIIAEQAAHLTVFQRTPNYSVPAANRPIDREMEREIKADYAGFRERENREQIAFGSRFQASDVSILDLSPGERTKVYEKYWQIGGLLFLYASTDMLINKEANETAAEFIRGKIRSIVKDKATAELLCPDTVVGCKRLCADTGYFETYNRPNVKLVDVELAPIEELTPRGLRTGGKEYELDCIVFATGFDAMTGSLLRMDIKGRKGLSLQQKWSEGPRTYLGLTVVGFPNMFIISGPGSPSVLTNMVPSIEQHVNWISDTIRDLRERQLSCIEPVVEAENAWVEHVNEVGASTLFPTCNSWYLGANIPGKPRVFMPYLGFPAYVEKCNQVRANGYEGFALSKA